MEQRYKLTSEEERPIIELPTLVTLGIIFLAFMLGATFLFLPWYFTLFIFLVLCVSIAIFFNPYIGAIIFISGAFLHPTEYLVALRPLHLARTLALLVFFIWAFHAIVYRDFKIVKAPQNFLMVGLCSMYFLSSFRYPDYSLPIFLDFIPKILILYFIIIHLVKMRKQAIILFWTLVVLAFIVSLVGIYQHKAGIGMRYLDGMIRIKGTEVDPNFFAVQLVMLVPIILNLFLVNRYWSMRTLLIGVIILLLLTIIFTYSRTGIACLGVALFLFVVRPIFQKQKNWIPLMTGILALLVFLPFVPAKYWERVKSITDFEDPAIRARLDTWRVGAEIISEAPFAGVGYGAFRFEYGQRAAGAPDVHTKAYLVAHNSYIELAAEAGIFALILFSLLIFWTIKDLRKAQHNFQSRNDTFMLNLSQALENSFLVFLIGAFFLSIMHLLILWVVIPLAVVMKNISIYKK